MTTIEHLARILCAKALPRSPERRLQDAIAEVMQDHGLSYEREVRLSSDDIIDFVVEERVGLEVKIDDSLSKVTRQLHRYAQSDRVAELLLVTTRARHKPMPAAFAGKPIHVLHLIAGAL